jgi:hypothetical protein
MPHMRAFAALVVLSTLAGLGLHLSRLRAISGPASTG